MSIRCSNEMKFTQIKVQKMFALLTIFFGFTTLVAGYFTNNFRQSTFDELADAESYLHMEVLHITATDGVALKALLITSPSVQNKTDHAAPVVISCHGMGDNYLAYMDFYYLLARKGYVVIAPESRGHGSNPAPLTLGVKEPLDLIQWLDYAGTDLLYVNNKNAGIYGFSMGGYYATMAYIIESKQQQRFHALVDVSGLVNVSRQIEAVTNDPSFFGPIPILQNITEKNAVNYVNSTFPRNVMIFHGDADQTVDVRSSYDFKAALDPENTRSDVEYLIRPGLDHNDVGFNDTTYRIAASWFDKHLLNITTDPALMYMPTNPVSSFNGLMIYSWFLGFCLSAILFVGSSVYVIKPKLFFRKGHPERDVILSSLWKNPTKLPLNASGSDLTSDKSMRSTLETSATLPEPSLLQSNPPDQFENSPKMVLKRILSSLNTGIKPQFLFNVVSWKDRAIFCLILCNCVFCAGSIGYWLNQTILVKIGFYVAGIIAAFLLCQYIANRKRIWSQIHPIIGEALHFETGLLFSSIVAIGFFSFLIVESNPAEIDATLGPGARFTPLMPMLTFIFLGFLGCLLLFIRCFLTPGYPKTYGARLIEDLVFGGLLSLTFGLCFVWNAATLLWGMLIVQQVMIICFWGGSILMIVLHFFERIHKSILPFLVFLAMAFAIGIASSPIYIIF